MSMNHGEIGGAIAARIDAQRASLREAWLASEPVKHILMDDVLAPDLARSIAAAFPRAEEMMLRSDLRERKRVSAAINTLSQPAREALYAFQDARIVAALEEITGVSNMVADPSFYASGLSLMQRGDFLNPHLDNSHDGDIRTYRRLNLLYYCSPEWTLENGGNLELWRRGIRDGHTIVSRFNRLVVMATDSNSWHSVSPVEADVRRLCVSNYYFSQEAPSGDSAFRVTTFAGRPEQHVRGLILKVDGVARNAIRRMFPRGLAETKHRFNKDNAAGETTTGQPPSRDHQ